MAKINMLQSGTQGVDMKSNELTLQNRKLHAATNIRFEEGRIKTRPGIRYRSLGASGQFQGAAEFRPKQGLSATPLTESADKGIALIADGDLYLNCRKIEADLKGRGDVHVFQAENYLVLQNLQSSTRWWDGEELTESPGLNEVDFREVETPSQELDVEAPVAQDVSCGTDLGVVTLEILVTNSVTETPLSGATLEIYQNGTLASRGVSEADGTFTTGLTPGNYTLSYSKEGFQETEDIDFTIESQTTEYTFDPCFEPLEITAGQTSLNVRITPFSCEVEWTTSSVDEDPLTGDPTVVADRWVVEDDGASIRYNIEDSANCGGTNDQIQTGLAEATFVVGGSDALLYLDFSGIAEVEDTGFENISFFLDEVLVASATSPGDNEPPVSNCDMGPIVPTYHVSPPYLLNAGGSYDFRIEFTTNDELFHVGAFYQIDLRCSPTS